MDTPSEWVGRKVKIVDGIDGTIGEVGTVLAIDDTPYRPSAWVRVHEDSDYPSYRSCDLCWLEDIETSESGPVWGTDGPQGAMARRAMWRGTKQ
jgi:hypothetical protein